MPVVIKFGAHMDIVLIIKVKILVLIKWSHSPLLPSSPKSWLLLSLEWWAILSTHSSLFSKHMTFRCLFLDPHLTTLSHSTIGIHIIAMFGLTFEGRSKVTSKSLKTIWVQFQNSLKQIDSSYGRSHHTDERFVELGPVTQFWTIYVPKIRRLWRKCACS